MRRDADLTDNSIYHTENDLWWQPDSALYLLKTSVNPDMIYGRVRLCRKVLESITATVNRRK